MERKTEFLSLDFFSLLYAVKKRYLKYGFVARTSWDTDKTRLIPAVFIGELPIFIDILDNCICDMLSNDYWKYTPYLCDFRIDEEKRKVYFTHSGKEKIDESIVNAEPSIDFTLLSEDTLEITCDLGELYRVYCYSYFSENNYKMMVGGFSNVRKTPVKQYYPT
jgi:hypothetical protein